MRLLRILRNRLFREFLEARILAQRIKHGIEPEQRRVSRESLALLFRRERGDDFLKPWIATKRVPEGEQL
jgi:hypothetical protein